MKEFELQIRLRNNRLKERREKLGLTQAEMADVIGVSRAIYNGFESLNVKSQKSGVWRRDALKVAEYFDVEPSEIFPPSVRQVEVSSTKRALDGDELAAMVSVHRLRSVENPENVLLALEGRVEVLAAVKSAAAKLTSREALVLRRSFGLDGEEPESLTEIATHHTKTSCAWVGEVRRRALVKLQRIASKDLRKRERQDDEKVK
jgi:transcriptional regulator with XRE-family HTH domain